MGAARYSHCFRQLGLLYHYIMTLYCSQYVLTLPPQIRLREQERIGIVKLVANQTKASIGKRNVLTTKFHMMAREPFFKKVVVSINGP